MLEFPFRQPSNAKWQRWGHYFMVRAVFQLQNMTYFVKKNREQIRFPKGQASFEGLEFVTFPGDLELRILGRVQVNKPTMASGILSDPNWFNWSVVEFQSPTASGKEGRGHS